MLEIIDKGGIISWGLLALSVVTVALILFKLFQFISLRLGNTQFVARTLDAIHQGNLEIAHNNLKKSKHPVATVLDKSLSLYQSQSPSDATREAIQVQGNLALSHLRSYLPWLDTIAHIAPMLGLLGTVVGMIKAFRELAGAGVQVDITLLSTGIWEALLTTAIGLVISVIALIAVNGFESKIAHTREQMSVAVSKLSQLIGA